MLNMDIPRAPFIEIFQQGEFTPCLPNVSRFETEFCFFYMLSYLLFIVPFVSVFLWKTLKATGLQRAQQSPWLDK